MHREQDFMSIVFAQAPPARRAARRAAKRVTWTATLGGTNRCHSER